MSGVDKMAIVVTNPDCLDGGPEWCCIDSDGTGLWCNSCLHVEIGTLRARLSEALHHENNAHACSVLRRRWHAQDGRSDR